MGGPLPRTWRPEPSRRVGDFTFKGVRDPSLGELRIETTEGGWRAVVDVRLPDGVAARVCVDHLGRLSTSE